MQLPKNKFLLLFINIISIVLLLFLAVFIFGIVYKLCPYILGTYCKLWQFSLNSKSPAPLILYVIWIIPSLLVSQLIWFPDTSNIRFESRMYKGFKDACIKIFDYKGSTSRTDFWNFILWGTLLNLLFRNIIFIQPITSLVFILINLVGISCSVRRLRDINKSWYWTLLALIPILGTIPWIYFMCQPSAINDSVK